MPGGTPAPVHLLLGEEGFLRERRLRELVERHKPAENAAYNLEQWSGSDTDLDRVVESCEMLPIFSERRLVVLRNADLRACCNHAGFIAYLRRPNPTTVLLLSAEGFGSGRQGRDDEGTPPAGKGKGKPAAKVTQKELMALLPSREEFPALRSDAAQDFLRQAARARGVELAPAAASELLELVGCDAARLDDEVEKAALFVGDRKRIEAADVEALARRSRTHTIFELTDAIAVGEREAVLRHLGALYEDGAEPLMMVGMIAWHLRRTLRGAALAEAGTRASDIGRTIGVPFRTADRFGAMCARMGTLGAANAIRALRDVDRRLKSTAEDEKLVLERALLELVPGAPPPPRAPGRPAFSARR